MPLGYGGCNRNYDAMQHSGYLVSWEIKEDPDNGAPPLRVITVKDCSREGINSSNR